MKQLGMLFLLTVGLTSAQAQKSRPIKPNLDILSFGVRTKGSRLASANTTRSDMPRVEEPRDTMSRPGTDLPQQVSQPPTPLSDLWGNPSPGNSNRNPEFVYRIKVRNTDQRTIQRIFWQYAVANASLPVRRFGCDAAIKPNQQKEFKVSSPLQPPQAVTVRNGFKVYNPHPGTQIVTVSPGAKKIVTDGQPAVTRIEYSDGSAWHSGEIAPSLFTGSGSAEANGRMLKDRCTWF